MTYKTFGKCAYCYKQLQQPDSKVQFEGQIYHAKCYDLIDEDLKKPKPVEAVEKAKPVETIEKSKTC